MRANRSARANHFERHETGRRAVDSIEKPLRVAAPRNYRAFFNGRYPVGPILAQPDAFERMASGNDGANGQGLQIKRILRRGGRSSNACRLVAHARGFQLTGKGGLRDMATIAAQALATAARTSGDSMNAPAGATP